MQKYVTGFMFDYTNQFVVLIQKTKPSWQAGLLNGVGGKIEPNETPLEAMIREFKEETGVDLLEDDWEQFCTLIGENTHVEFFFTYQPEPIVRAVRSMTEEVVQVYEIDKLKTLGTIPNIQWLVPMALSMWDDNAQSFVIHEQYKNFTEV